MEKTKKALLSEMGYAKLREEKRKRRKKYE